MSDVPEGSDGCRCSQDLRRFEFVLMDDGKTINRYECSDGRYVLYDDVKRREIAEMASLDSQFFEAGRKADAATVNANREYHRGVQDGLLAWIVVKMCVGRACSARAKPSRFDS